MRKPTVYPAPKDMSIKALQKILLREDIEESNRNNEEWSALQENSRQAVRDCPHLSNELLNEYSPSNAYLLERAYPTKQTRMSLEEPTGLPLSEVGLIMFAATTPHIIFILIVVYLAIYGF